MISSPIPPQIEIIIEILDRAKAGTATSNDLDQLKMNIEDVENHLSLVAKALSRTDKTASRHSEPPTFEFRPEDAANAKTALRYLPALSAAAARATNWEKASIAAIRIKETMA